MNRNDRRIFRTTAAALALAVAALLYVLFTTFRLQDRIYPPPSTLKPTPPAPAATPPAGRRAPATPEPPTMP